MPSSGRMTRGAAAAADELAHLNTRDRLIFAQAVYEHGASPGTWGEIAKLLTGHPLLTKSKFTPQACSALHSQLLKDSQLSWDETCAAKKSKINMKLCQSYYRDHANFLKDEIAAEEARFKAIAAEVEDIRSGKWDDRIRASLRGEKVSLEMMSTTESESPVIVVDEDTKLSPATKEDTKETNDLTSKLAVPPEPSGSRTSDDHVSQISPLTPLAKEPSSAGMQKELEPVESESPVPELATLARGNESKDEAQEEKHGEDGEEEEEEEEEGEEEEGAADEETPVPDMSNDESRESTPVIRTRRKVHKRGASEVETDGNDSIRERKRLRDESEPVEDADSPAASSVPGSRAPKDRKRFQGFIQMLHTEITGHRNGSIFHNPIKPSEAPDYRDIVKRPMDLKTIKNRVRDGRISSTAEYIRDVYLMFANAIMYNKPGSTVYNMAEEMMVDSEAAMADFQRNEKFNARSRS